MASVVIIHAAENALPARALADKLRAMRLTPVIELPPGDALRQAIQDSVAAVALWSPGSVDQQALLDEAARAGAKLINARMQNAPAPSQFSGAPTIDLTGWRGEDTFGGWRALAAEVAKKAGVASPSAPAPAAAPPQAPPPQQQPTAGPGFFTPGPAAPPAAAPPPRPTPVPPAPPQTVAAPAPPRAAPPRPVEPSYETTSYDEPAPKRSANLAVIGIVTFLVVAAVGVGGYFFYERMQSSAAATAAWDELDKTDPASLRAFLDGPNVGQFEEEAENALEGLEVERLAEARATDTIDSLEAFLRDFPGSRHSLEINGRIAELRTATPALAPIDPLTGLPIDPNAPAPAGATGVEAPEPETPSAQTPAPSGGGPVPLTPPEETLPDGTLDSQTQ